MEIDQWVFKKLYHPIKNLLAKKKSPELIERTVELSSLKQRLSIFACLISGETIRIQEAEKEGGYRGNVFYLPTSYYHGPSLKDNTDFYIFRVLYLTFQKKLQLNWEKEGIYNRTHSLQKAKNAFPGVLEEIHKHFPETKEWIQNICKHESTFQEQLSNKTFPLSYLHGVFMSPEKREDSSSMSLRDSDRKLQSYSTEKEGKPKEEVIVLEENKEKTREYTLNHNFEKIETVEEFKGDWRTLDGEDELDTHEEALNELDLRHLIRTEESSSSLYKSDVLRADIPLEAKDVIYTENRFLYDEWNYKKKGYRKNYCSVLEYPFTQKHSSYYSECLNKNALTLKQLKEKMNRLANQLESVRHQEYGEELDMDSLLDYTVQLLSHSSPNERVYVSKRKQKRDMSLLLLIDLSLSTDGYVSNNRILDVEKESVILLGELCNEYEDRFRIDCFSSKTRNDCEYINVKSFSDTWDSKKHFIGALEPRGYTRIGPAIRHAKSILEKEVSRKKWILLLSDGKPNDYDRYEGKYGIEDVKKAVQECEKSNIHLFALAIEKSAKDYLPPMLGEGRFQILNHPKKLPQAMADIYSRVFR